MTYRALLIGNSVFEADASLNPLNAPTKDVARLHRALVDSATGLFADEHVRLVIERTSDDLLDELDAFFSAAHRDDLLLLYYSGHGLLDERNQLFLCGRNTRSDRLLRSAVSNVRINEFIEQSVARCTVIILDCCSSGMFKGGDVGIPLAGPGRYVMSSTRGSALANDAAIATGTSLFTEHLVVGLLGGAEDRDGDGYLNLGEIYDYVRTKLTATTKQIPHSRFDGDASVVLARRPDTSGAKDGPPHPARPGDPTFVLSENVITLYDVDPGERLSPELVDIYPLGDKGVDCTAETDSLWLRAEVQGDRVVVELRPTSGHNRGKIVVRDRESGTTQVLRVHVVVRGGDQQPAAGAVRPAPRDQDAPTRVLARASVPPTAGSLSARPPTPPSGPRAELPGAAAGGGRTDKRRRSLLVSALAAILVLGAIGTAYAMSNKKGFGTAPSLVGLSQTDAETKLQKAGMTATVVAAAPATSCVPGRVVAQSPAADQPIRSETTVRVTVCGAAQPVPAPDVVGKAEKDAIATITGLKLKARAAGPTASVASCVKGIVIAQSPAPAQPLAEGATVTYSLCPGSTSTPTIRPAPKVVVPQLGDTRDTADSALRKAGLHGKYVTRVSKEDVGKVIDSTPRSGSSVASGSTITVHLSGGSVTVPSVDGLPEEEAVRRIGGWQLIARPVYRTSAGVEPGTVIDSDPPAGQEVEYGSTVTLVIAKLPPSGGGTAG
jgi:beta-lactam-binding protein with PASTA domain